MVGERLVVFGPFQLDLEQRLLQRDGQPVPLPPKALSILCVLAERRGALVEYDELMKRVWPDVFVEEGNLKVHVFALRKALGGGRDGTPAIETIPRRGYRLVLPIREAGDRPHGPAAAEPAGRLERATPVQVPAGAVLARRPAEAPSRRVGFRPLRWSVLALAVLAGASWLAVTAAPRPPEIAEVVQLTHFGKATGVVTDGARLYIGEQVGGRSLIAEVSRDGGDPTPLATPFPNVDLLDISPERSELLVASFDAPNDRKALWILPLVGGSPRRVGAVFSDSARWSPDGRRIAFVGDDGALVVAEASGAAMRKVAAGSATVDAWFANGRTILFTRVNPATGGMSLWEVGADGAGLRSFLPERQNPNAVWGEGQSWGSWTADGEFVLFRDALHARRSLWAVRNPGAVLPFSSHKPVEIYASSMDIGRPVVGDNGRRIYVVGTNQSRELARYDWTLQQFVPFLSGASGGLVSSPPGGDALAYVTFPEGNLWRARADGTDRRQLSFPPELAFASAWSPDGTRIAFHTLAPGKPGKIALVSADGGAEETLFPDDPSEEDAPNWSPDGKRLMFGRTWVDRDGNATSAAICVLDLRTGAVSTLPGGENLGPPSWSHTGRYVVAPSADFRSLLLFDVQVGTWRRLLRAGFIRLPTWSRDDRFVYFQDRTATDPQPIYRVSIPDGRMDEVVGRPRLRGSDPGHYLFMGLTPAGDPIAALIRDNADVYALDLGPVARLRAQAK
jgi:DNA-binding winged helix-turn-helix (wHTH) protein/Tol biopolymer transport system component